MPKHVYFDMDGTLIDSCPENFALVAQTWPAVSGGGKYPLDDEGFRQLIRPYITSPADFYSFTLAYVNGEDFRDPGNADAARKNYADVSRSGFAAFRSAREHMKHSNPKTWLAMQPPFRGVREMFRELDVLKRKYGARKGDYLRTFILSSKDDASLKMLASVNDFPVKDSFIFGDTMGAGGDVLDRREQLITLKRYYRPDAALMYDDSPLCLDGAKDAGVTPVAALYGYGDPDAMSSFKHKCASPMGFPSLAKKLLKL